MRVLMGGSGVGRRLLLLRSGRELGFIFELYVSQSFESTRKFLTDSIRLYTAAERSMDTRYPLSTRRRRSILPPRPKWLNERNPPFAKSRRSLQDDKLSLLLLLRPLALPRPLRSLPRPTSHSELDDLDIFPDRFNFRIIP